MGRQMTTVAGLLFSLETRRGGNEARQGKHAVDSVTFIQNRDLKLAPQRVSPRSLIMDPGSLADGLCKCAITPHLIHLIILHRFSAFK